MDSLPGSVGATDPTRAPHKELVHGAFARAASMRKSGGSHATHNPNSLCALLLGLTCNCRHIVCATHNIAASIAQGTCCDQFVMRWACRWRSINVCCTRMVICAAGGTPNTSILARSSSSMNGRVELMMSHLPDGQGGGTPKPSFKVISKKSTLHDLVQVSKVPPN